MRAGTGYDLHRLVPGRKLVLCGVEIPYEKGLLGHSDADVAAHAIMDALLGAAGIGDIGEIFPDSDPRWEGADSLAMLSVVCDMVQEKLLIIENIDCTIIAERPKLAPYKAQMRRNIAEAAGLEEDRVCIKATTEEGLGVTGSGDCIAAQAVCSLTYAFGQGGGCPGCSLVR